MNHGGSMASHKCPPHDDVPNSSATTLIDSQKFVLRFFPSLTDLAFLAPAVLLFSLMGGTKTLLSDGDPGWHIRTGDWILQNGRIPHTDLFSFTKAGQPWFAFGWLWDVLFAWIHQHGGMAAVLAVSTFVLCLTFALLFRVVRSQCGNDFIAIGVTMLAVAGSSLHFVARPHLFTLLFAVILYSVLERTQTSGGRWLFTVPVLVLMWANLHAGFLAGIIIIGAFACGRLIRFLVAPQAEDARLALIDFYRNSLLAAACVLAALVNPYGYHLLVHIYSFLTDPFTLRNVAEYQVVDFRTPAGRCFEVMLVLGAIAAFVRIQRKDFGHVLLFGIWAHLALTSQRHIPIFMIIAAPSVAFALHEMLIAIRRAPVAGWIRRVASDIDRSAAEFASNDRIERFHVVSAAAMILLFLVLRSPGAPPKFRAEFDRQEYPEGAVAAFIKLGPSAKVFTTDLWGGYLTYRLYPSVRIFVDGRIDFYGSDYGRTVLDVLAGKDTWEKTFQRYGINAALVPVNVPLAAVLKQSERWRRVYADGKVIVFRQVAVS